MWNWWIMRIDCVYLHTGNMLIWGEKAYQGSSLTQTSRDIHSAMCNFKRFIQIKFELRVQNKEKALNPGMKQNGMNKKRKHFSSVPREIQIAREERHILI